jgi:alpha-glucosidase (family GH31 glycosyl hydrolase)
MPYLNQAGADAFAEERSMLEFRSRSAYSYTLGDDLFVAPILSEGGAISVVFPGEDEWIYLFDTDMRFIGGETASLVVPLDEYPVYVRAGSELALDIPSLAGE